MSIDRQHPTLLYQPYLQFSPPPSGAHRKSPTPSSKRQRRSSCAQTDGEPGSEREKGIFQKTLKQLPVNTLGKELPVKTSLPKLLHHAVRKALRRLHSQDLRAGGSFGDDELFLLNPKWNCQQQGQRSKPMSAEHRPRAGAGLYRAAGEEPGLWGQTAGVWILSVTTSWATLDTDHTCQRRESA